MPMFDQSRLLSKAGYARPRGLLLLPLAASLALAGCGGGSSTSDVIQQPVVRCTALDGGGSGFSLGVCTDPITLVASSAFQPIEATVFPRADSSYALTLTAPAKILSVVFEPTDSTRTQELTNTRDVIGALRGEAYENDADPSPPQEADPVPPYTALVDFRTAWNVEVEEGTPEPVVLQLEFANFGYWEQFTGQAADGGNFGGWYAKRSETAVTNDAPTLRTNYSGVAVGVLSPAEPGSRSYGFSATVGVVGDRDGVRSGEINSLKISYRDPAGKLVFQDVPLNGLQFAEPINNLEGQPSKASLLLVTASEVASVGKIEARFFGSTTSQGAEIAGRLRFETPDGMRGVGAFGARVVPGS